MKLYIYIVLLLINCKVYAQSECLFNKTGKSDSSILSNSLKESQAIIVGEFHGVLGVNEIKFNLIRKLNSEYQYKDIFMEIGKSAAYLYNLYLNSGDTSLLEKPTMPYCIKSKEKEFWKSLYEYNLDLPKSLKIVIHGVDFERIEFLKVLKLLIPKDYNTNNSDFTKNLLKDYDSIIISVKNYKDFNKLFSNYKNYFKANTPIINSIYGRNFKYIEDIFLNNSSQENFKERNETMYANVMEIVKKDSIKKVIGFFGMNHTNSEKSYSLIGKLIEDKYFKNIINISMLCKNCFDWQQYIKVSDYSGPYTYQRDKNLMESIFNNYFLTDCKFTIIPTSIIKAEKVKSFSDYLILLKDQPEFN